MDIWLFQVLADWTVKITDMNFLINIMNIVFIKYPIK